MKNLSTKTKILIGAGIVLAIFIIFLFILAGTSGGNKVPPQEELKKDITGITCQTESQGDFEYDLSIITNETDFDNVISSRKYNKIVINQTKDLNSLGLGFAVKSDSDTLITFTLMKNEEVIKSDMLNLTGGETSTANLSLEEPIKVLSTDEFYIDITLSEDTTFAIDTFLFFMDEVK